MKQATEASAAALQLATYKEKNAALERIAKALDTQREAIAAANQKDLAQATKENLADVLVKRLALSDTKIDGLIQGIKDLIALDDPIDKELDKIQLDDDLVLTKKTCPLGVIGIVFESRPDALVQIATLCIKSGNAVVMKGGKEALETNKCLATIIGEAAQLPSGWLQLLETRDDVQELLRCSEYIDLIIPRGSNAFVQHVMNNTNIPVLGHADGICHIYIDKDADLDMAVRVCTDAKCQYPAVCNAVETVLVHEAVKDVIPQLKEAMPDVTFVEDPASWATEYNDLTLAIKTVASASEAIEHINTYGSKHTDAIITNNKEAADTFLQEIDTANAFWNCSTRFSDGFRYGFGAEVGVSTSKIHARGPVGLDGLTSYKWILKGTGDTVKEYAEGVKQFTHKR
ncbi:MAG: glutamate-5-semialdehyde dehydrogenase [Candidatus Woesearchaeota archaeon]|nr:glutamate-5-semialdehyde dehydrogenase [Candidatus Woesearchaeota archaeon]